MISYPPAPSDDTVDIYFGTAVADPYRPLEDIDAPQTQAWLAAERALTNAYFAQLPNRDAIRARISGLMDYARTGIPQHANGTYVVAKNSGLQNQAVIYTMTGESGSARVLLDPNTLSPDGTVALSAGSLSHDGRLFAYALQQAGSDWQTWHVRDIATGRDLPETLRWSKFSTASWSADNAGFFYSGYDEPADPAKLDIVAEHQKIFYHRIGTAQDRDALVYARPDAPKMYVSCDVSEDGRYLAIYESRGGIKNGLLVRDLQAEHAPAVRLFAEDVAQYGVVDIDGSHVFVFTTAHAPKGRLIRVDASKAVEIADVIPECADTLQSVSAVGERFFATYIHDAHTVVKIFTRDGAPAEPFALPGIGTAFGFGGRRDDTITYFLFTSFTTPETIFRYDVATAETTTYAASASPFDARAYDTEQLFATSRDGTRVPVFVMRAKDTPNDGSSRTILYGYGGFDISLTPAFSSTIAAWIANGSTYAVANLRGGGEFGQAWHEAGMGASKQNVFDDFIAVADYLVAGGYTSRAKLALAGGSNGGLLCAAVMTQRPDLAAAILCDVGVMDMLRFHKFTVGAGWIPEYGCAESSEAEFRTLLAYSPLANVRGETRYPATLISTGDHDDRVFPAHSFKFAAALQAAQRGEEPVLLYLENDAGHGAGKPLSKLIDKTTDRFAFLERVLA